MSLNHFSIIWLIIPDLIIKTRCICIVYFFYYFEENKCGQVNKLILLVAWDVNVLVSTIIQKAPHSACNLFISLYDECYHGKTGKFCIKIQVEWSYHFPQSLFYFLGLILFNVIFINHPTRNAYETRQDVNNIPIFVSHKAV